MRVSPVGFAFDTESEVLEQAKATAEAKAYGSAAAPSPYGSPYGSAATAKGAGPAPQDSWGTVGSGVSRTQFRALVEELNRSGTVR